MEPSQERRLDQWGDNPSPSLKPFDSGWGGGAFLSAGSVFPRTTE